MNENYWISSWSIMSKPTLMLSINFVHLQTTTKDMHIYILNVIIPSPLQLNFTDFHTLYIQKNLLCSYYFFHLHNVHLVQKFSILRVKILCNFWYIIETYNLLLIYIQDLQVLILCKIWGLHGSDHEECNLLGYK
jgi:hypothetical protein